MKKSELSITGLIVFIFGALVLVVAWILLSPFFPDTQDKFTFSCISVLLVYGLYFLPMFLAPFRGDPAGIAVSGTVYYKGVSGYTLVSAANIFFLFRFFPLAVSIVIQCAALFVLLIWAFMALFSKAHVDSSLQAEESKKSMLMDLRDKAKRLAAMTSGLEKNAPARVLAEKIAEDMRYLSPSDTSAARDLERRLLAKLDAILMDSSLTSGVDFISDSLQSKFSEFDTLYKERKNIY